METQYKTKDKKFIINGVIVDSYIYNKYEKRYYFYNEYNMIICSIESKKKTYNDMVKCFGDEEK